jgi:hypothetical protein
MNISGRAIAKALTLPLAIVEVEVFTQACKQNRYSDLLFDVELLVFNFA